jgi:DNA-binding response OmpR family regulator
MTGRILIVEDEEAMREGLRDNLEIEGYEVHVAADGVIGENMVKEMQFDLLILDWMLPKRSGIDVCRNIRQAGQTLPILMLTAKSEEIDKVLGLELGADDYLTKPFGLHELLARIKALLRRSGGDNRQSEVQMGALQINFDKYTAQVDGESVHLTHKEIEILRFLYARRDETVSRDELLRQVWGHDYLPSTRTVDNFILRLRNVIENDARHPQHLLTVHGLGYKFVP